MKLRCSWGKAGCPVLVSGAYKASWIDALYGAGAGSNTIAIYDAEGY